MSGGKRTIIELVLYSCPKDSKYLSKYVRPCFSKLNYDYNSAFRRTWNRSFKNSPGSCLDSWGRSWQFNQVVPSGTRVDLVFSAGCIPYGLHWGHVMDQLPSKFRSLLQKECLSTNRHGFWNPRFLYSFISIRNQDFDLEKIGSRTSWFVLLQEDVDKVQICF